MKQILWFRRDLRINDNAILQMAQDEVLPIFIFDKNILDKLNKDDIRVTFIYKSVLELKEKLQKIGLDLAIFYADPIEIFSKFKDLGFEKILCSVDFDYYSKLRDKYIEEIIPIERYYDSYIIEPNSAMKKDGTAYKVFTPFYNSLSYIWQSSHIEEYKVNPSLKLIDFDFTDIPSIEFMGFNKIQLPKFLLKDGNTILEEFLINIDKYEKERDFFFKDSSSNLGVYLRFGLLSPKEVFNKAKTLKPFESTAFIRQLFWREFYSYILFHYPNSEFENFNGLEISWNENEEDFIKWCEGNTGIPIIDAAMRYFNQTGIMHNRLRMIVASYLTKNLLIDWKKGESYFASKLLDYDCASNVGSWQWAASTGADAVPYFRIFNPYLQSAKFDKGGVFIKSVIPELKDVDANLFHKENALNTSLFISYPKEIVSISFSRDRAIKEFKRAKNEKV